MAIPKRFLKKTPGQEPATPHEAQPVAEEPARNTSGQVSLIITSCGLGTYDATKIIQEIRPELGTFDTYQLMRDFPNTIADNLGRMQLLNSRNDWRMLGAPWRLNRETYP